MTEQADEWPPERARTMEDWDTYWQRQRWDRRFVRKVIRPRWARLKRRAMAPLRWQREARWAVHRARRGWAAPDTWNLDSYLCELIGQSVAHLRDKGHGYQCLGRAEDCWMPDGPGCDCEQEWKVILTRISDPLLAYKSHWDYPGGESVEQHIEREKKVISDAQDALRLMAEHLPGLWD